MIRASKRPAGPKKNAVDPKENALPGLDDGAHTSIRPPGKAFVQAEFPHKFMPLGYSDQEYADVSGYILEQALLNHQTP